jgi:hypothetical protein
VSYDDTDIAGSGQQPGQPPVRSIQKIRAKQQVLRRVASHRELRKYHHFAGKLSACLIAGREHLIYIAVYITNGKIQLRNCYGEMLHWEILRN